VPVSREKQVFYYYKRFEPNSSDTDATLANPPPAEKTIYVVHFLQPIQESFIMKTFSHAGQIKQVHIGTFKPKASRKKQKRTLHFALVVFKKPESVDALLKDSKMLQKKVNKIANKAIGFMHNPFLKGEENLMSDGEGSEELDDEAQ